jgi:hypothetical protein
MMQGQQVGTDEQKRGRKEIWKLDIFIFLSRFVEMIGWLAAVGRFQRQLPWTAGL